MNSHSSTLATISSSLAPHPFPHHHNHHDAPPLPFKFSSSIRANLVLRPVVAGIGVGGSNSAASSSIHHSLLPSSCFTISPLTHLQFRQKGKTHLQFKQKAQLGKASAQLVTGEEAVDDVVSTSADEDVVKRSVSILKLAAKTRKVPPPEVLGAIRSLEKAKLDPSNFLATIGGTESPGRTWMLIFVSSAKQDREAMKGAPGGGNYFPVTAVQRFDAATMTIENGIYLGPLGFLTFKGIFSWDKRILSFIFTTLSLKIGPFGLLEFDISKKEDLGRTPGKENPFLTWYYADDEIIVSRGKRGGLAFWCRCNKVTT